MPSNEAITPSQSPGPTPYEAGIRWNRDGVVGLPASELTGRTPETEIDHSNNVAMKALAGVFRAER